MPQTNIVLWNIRDLNTDQIADNYVIRLIAGIITQENASMAVILETKSDQGNQLVTRLRNRLGAGWAGHSSPKSAPHSNKPENYVFLFRTAIWGAAPTVTHFPALPADANGKLRGFPKQHGNPRKKSPSRYPYVAKFTTTATLNSRAITFVAYHAPFDITVPECCLNLNHIPDVGADANVIVLGDFNEETHNQRSYRYQLSFTNGLCTGGAFVNLIDYNSDADLTTLKKDYYAGYTYLQSRNCLYDNFFLKTGGQLDTANSTASVIDNLVNLTHPNYLHDFGRRVFNNAVNRRIAAGKAAPPVFGPGENIQDAEDAHEVHWNHLSDHLPVKLILHVN